MKEGGFGHTIHGPDVVRRLFTNGNCVFIALSEYRRHNRKVSSIWPDIHLIFLPLNLGFKLGPLHLVLPHAVGWFKGLLAWVCFQYTKVISPSDTCYLTLDELYARTPVPLSLKPFLGSLDMIWPMGYFELLRTVKRPRLQLPAVQCTLIRTKLDEQASAAGAEGVLRCCLYLRQKGKDHPDLSTSRRVGSPLEAYLPAISLLNHAGYQVLLTGDVSLDPSQYQEFGGMLVDAANLDCDADVFYLFAATEAEIGIAETGGGNNLPVCNGMPLLLTNAFPYFFALPNSWVYYKTVWTPDGKLVPFQQLFCEHAFDVELKGLTLRDNTADELCRAVSCFVADVGQLTAFDPGAAIMEGLPDYLWLKQARAKLSPAWVELYAD